MMRYKSFRFCMLIGALALLAVALFYFINYAVVLDIALSNSGILPPLAASIRALWLAFACQALLIAVLYTLVAFRPPSVSREVIVLFGLLQILEAFLLLTMAGNSWMAYLLVAAALCVLIGTFLWPKQWPLPVPEPVVVAPADAATQATLPAAGSAPDLPPPAGQTLLPGSQDYPPR
jgi:hypothetical protein